MTEDGDSFEDIDSMEEFLERYDPEAKQLIDELGSDGLKQMGRIMDSFSEELRDEWERIRGVRHNPTQKGGSFENTLQEYLELYFGSVFDFKTGCALIDPELRCFKEFTPRSNEFDVVASFKTAIPNVVFEEAGLFWMAYDGVAFLCEVKSSLNKPDLEHDLEKLETLAELRGDPRERFGGNVAGHVDVNHQLHCLVYDKNEISKTERNRLLDAYPEAWDLLLVVEEDELLINSTLPIGEELFGSGADGQTLTWCHIDNGFLWFVMALTMSIPRPTVVDTTKPMIRMATFLGTSTGGGRYRQS